MTASRLAARRTLATTSALALAIGWAIAPAAAQTTSVPGDRNVAPSSAAVEPKTPAETPAGNPSGQSSAPVATNQDLTQQDGNNPEAAPDDILVVGTRASLLASREWQRRRESQEVPHG